MYPLQEVKVSWRLLFGGVESVARFEVSRGAPLTVPHTRTRSLLF